MTIQKILKPKLFNPTSYGTSIQVENLCKVFGNQLVLSEINLTIKSGEFIAVVGKSGCGKSTFLRLLAGLEKPSQGTIYLNSHPLKGLNTQSRVMFQDSRLLPWRRVFKNVILGLKNHAYDRGLWALQQVGLDDRAHDWTTVLSGGQKQRVALARALVNQPPLMLLDEPLGALDALTRFEMQKLIQSLWQEQQFTAVLVTHDVEEAIYLADRVIVIKHGKIDLDMPVSLDRPRSTETPVFIRLKHQILQRILEQC